VASTKGRPVKGSDAVALGHRLDGDDASTKGRPVKGSDRPAGQAVHPAPAASTKGRPVKGSDNGFSFRPPPPQLPQRRAAR